MAGTFVINAAETFQRVIFMSCAEKVDFKTGAVETNPQGVPKWTIEAAVTFHPGAPGMRAQSEVITATITQHGNPGDGVMPGSPVELLGLRVGFSIPERNERGGVRGGKPWYQASGIRPAGAMGRPSKAEAAA